MRNFCPFYFSKNIFALPMAGLMYPLLQIFFPRKVEFTEIQNEHWSTGGARGSVVDKTLLQALKITGLRPDNVNEFLQFTLLFRPH
jgi:hypothetical protein